MQEAAEVRPDTASPFKSEEGRTFRWSVLELLVHSTWFIAGCALLYPFAAGLYFGAEPSEKGFWPSTFTGPLLSAPIFIIGLCISIAHQRLKITLNSEGISWSTLFRSHEIRWAEVNFIAESPKYLYSLIVDTENKRWTIPLTGMPGSIPLRKLISMQNLEPPIDLVLSQSRNWRLARFLAVFCTSLLLVQAVNGIQAIFWSRPFDESHLRFIDTLSYIPIILCISTVSSHLSSQTTSLDIVSESLVYKNGFKRALKLPLNQITSISYKLDSNMVNRKLVVSANELKIGIPENFPNLELIAKELARQTSVPISDQNESPG